MTAHTNLAQTLEIQKLKQLREDTKRLESQITQRLNTFQESISSRFPKEQPEVMWVGDLLNYLNRIKLR